jgi:hypothetical protein
MFQAGTAGGTFSKHNIVGTVQGRGSRTHNSSRSCCLRRAGICGNLDEDIVLMGWSIV